MQEIHGVPRDGFRAMPALRNRWGRSVFERQLGAGVNAILDAMEPAELSENGEPLWFVDDVRAAMGMPEITASYDDDDCDDD